MSLDLLETTDMKELEVASSNWSESDILRNEMALGEAVTGFETGSHYEVAEDRNVSRGFTEVLGATYRTEHTGVSVFNALSDEGLFYEDDPQWDMNQYDLGDRPVEVIHGAKNKLQADRMVKVYDSEVEAKFIQQQASMVQGLMAGVVVFATDPINWVGGTAVTKGAQIINRGIAKTMASKAMVTSGVSLAGVTGAFTASNLTRMGKVMDGYIGRKVAQETTEGAIRTAVTESLLQVSQDNRTLMESMINLATDTVFGSLVDTIMTKVTVSPSDVLDPSTVRNLLDTKNKGLNVYLAEQFDRAEKYSKGLDVDGYTLAQLEKTLKPFKLSDDKFTMTPELREYLKTLPSGSRTVEEKRIKLEYENYQKLKSTVVEQDEDVSNFDDIDYEIDEDEYLAELEAETENSNPVLGTPDIDYGKLFGGI